VSGQVPLILGTGSNSTAITIEKTKAAKNVQGVLVVVPYYNKPPQRGLYEHFKAVALSTDLPVVLYNVPGRTITSLELETIIKLSEIDNIVAIKEATGNIEFGEQIIKNTKNFAVLSGDDKTFLELADKGGKGVIAVASHLIGDVMGQLYRKLKAGDMSALKNYEKYFDLIDSIYLEANPIPIKYALYKKQIIESPEMRLPLVTLREDFQQKVSLAMEILK
jgi:4-hydroxy-tetrahydrodipicolinate synthase